MAAALPIMAVAGTALKAGGTILGANAEAKELKKEARQLKDQAGTERATSQRQAMEERRQSRLAQSRTQALAAASGGGADDPTVVNIMANLEGEGEYRALASLYEGEEQARGLEAQAAARRREAKNTKRAGYINAGGTILQSAGSMYDRYGK